MEPHEILREDSTLAPLIDRHGELRLDPADDLFARLVTSIIRQQVSMAAASAIHDRLESRVHLTPVGILEADPADLREAGLSEQKVGYLIDAAETFQEHEYTKEALADHPDEEIRDRLTEIAGVGPWTANMQLLFTFGREDIFPVGDLGVRAGMAELFDLQRSDRDRMVEIASRWAPYRSYATLYLWRVEEDVVDAVSEVTTS